MNNYTNIDYNKNQIKQASIWPLDTPPIGPVVGMTYFDTTLKTLRSWDGQRWVSAADLPIAGVGEEGALGGIRVGDRLTIDPTNGLLSADIQSENNLTDELLEKILNIENYIDDHDKDIGSHQYILDLITAETTTRLLKDNKIINSLDLEIQRAMSAESSLQNTKEDKSNKTTKIDQNSTNTQYPSAAATYEALIKRVEANPLITASNEYRVVKYDSKGLVIDGRKITSDDVTNIDASKIGDGSISNTEFKYLDGVTSNIQNQINDINDNKANKVDGKDLSDVKTELENELKQVNNIIGTSEKDFSDSVVKRVKDLSNIATVMQANSSKYSVSAINVTTAGSGYKVGETFNVGKGSYIAATIASVNANGGIVDLSWNNDLEFNTDIKGDNLNPMNYSGAGTGAKLQVLTNYAKGNKVVNGTLLHVPNQDPLVQYSRLQAYVAAEFAAQNEKGITGYISKTDPATISDTTIAVEQYWLQSNSTGLPDSNFPWQVKEWNGSGWSSLKDYNPKLNDIWVNKNVTDPLTSSGYYWMDKWLPYGFSFDPGSFVHTVNNETINGVKKFTSTIVGNIDTANALKTARNIALSGHTTGNANFKGDTNITIDTTISDNVIKNSMIQNKTIDIGKMADQKITAINSYTSLPTNYAVNNTKTQQAWLNDFASRLNYLVNNKNTIFVQTTQPVPNRTGDIWVTVAT